MSARLPVTLDGPAGVGKPPLRDAWPKGWAFLPRYRAMFRCMALKLGAGAETLPNELRTRCAQWTFPYGPWSAIYAVLQRRSRTWRSAHRSCGHAGGPHNHYCPLYARFCVPQRAIGEHSPLVAEGRDMGTVIVSGAFKFSRCGARVRANGRCCTTRTKRSPSLTEQIRQRD